MVVEAEAPAKRKIKTEEIRVAAYLIVDTLLENPELYEEYKLRAKLSARV
jgi:hypothetical protein